MDAIELTLKQLVEDNPKILLSMVVTSDGLSLAYEGNVDDYELIGALYIELQLKCAKIMASLGYGGVEEVLVRSRAGIVQIVPIMDKGILASLATPDVNALKMQIMTWRAARQIGRVIVHV